MLLNTRANFDYILNSDKSSILVICLILLFQTRSVFSAAEMLGLWNVALTNQHFGMSSHGTEHCGKSVCDSFEFKELTFPLVTMYLYKFCACYNCLFFTTWIKNYSVDLVKFDYVVGVQFKQHNFPYFLTFFLSSCQYLWLLQSFI